LFSQLSQLLSSNHVNQRALSKTDNLRPDADSPTDGQKALVDNQAADARGADALTRGVDAPRAIAVRTPVSAVDDNAADERLPEQAMCGANPWGVDVRDRL
jgi:hypothetical protein